MNPQRLADLDKASHNIDLARRSQAEALGRLSGTVALRKTLGQVQEPRLELSLGGGRRIWGSPEFLLGPHWDARLASIESHYRDEYNAAIEAHELAILAAARVVPA